MAELRKIGCPPALALMFSPFSGLTLITKGDPDNAAAPRSPSTPPFSSEVPGESQTIK